MSAPSFLSRFDFGGRRGRLSEQPHSIATIGTGVGAVRFYAIRACPGPLLFAATADRGYGRISYPKPPGFSPGISRFIRSPGLAAFARGFRLSKRRLLKLNLRADLFERGLDLLGFVLGHAFLDGFRRTLDQILGFLQPEPGERTHFLNHFDLLLARAGENDGELGLLFSRGGGATGRRARRNRNRGGTRTAPLLLKHLRGARR